MFEISIPFIVVFYFLYHSFKDNFKNILAGLVFVSFFVFSTNYENFGLGFDVYRYLHRIIGITLVISLLFYIFRNKINIFADPPPRLLFIFGLVLLLSFIGNNVNSYLYVHYLRNFIFIGLIVIYLYYVLDDDEKLENLFNLIISITLILSFCVIIEIFQKGWGNRVTLHFTNPNYLAYSFLPGLVFSAFHRNKYVGYIIVPLIIFAIFATGSRAAELSSIFILFLYIFQTNFNRAYILFFLSLIIVLFVLFYETILLNTNFNNARYVIFRIALNIIEAEPINGIGYGQFRISFMDYVDQEIFKMGSNDINDLLRGYTTLYGFSASVGQETAQSKPYFYYLNPSLEKMTHNDLITILVELGIFGLFFLFYFFYKILYELKKIILFDKRYFFISIGLIGASLLFSLFHNNLTSFVFWFVLIVPFIINRNKALKNEL